MKILALMLVSLVALAACNQSPPLTMVSNDDNAGGKFTPVSKNVTIAPSLPVATVPEMQVVVVAQAAENNGPGPVGNPGPGPVGNPGPGYEGNNGPGPVGNNGPGPVGNNGPGPVGNNGPGYEGNNGPGYEGNNGPGPVGIDGPN